MIVVADTAPLNHLIQIDCDALLFHLYERIIVPARVMQSYAIRLRRRPGEPAKSHSCLD